MTVVRRTRKSPVEYHLPYDVRRVPVASGLLGVVQLGHAAERVAERRDVAVAHRGIIGTNLGGSALYM